MKKIYMIYEEDWGHTGITFTSKKSAESYLKYLDAIHPNTYYFIKTKKLYDNFEECMSSNKKELISDLKEILNKLKDKDKWVKLHFKNGVFKMSYNEMEKVVKNNKLDVISWWSGDYHYKTVDSDLDVVIKKYNQINDKIKKYTKILNVLTKNENVEKSVYKDLEKTLNEEL